MTIQILELLNEDIDAILPLENELYHKPWQKKDYEYELNDNPFAYYLKLMNDFKLINNNYVNLSVADEFRWPTLTDPINDIKSTCLGGKHQIGILLNGDIVLCCLDYLGHTKIGNIYEESLSDVLGSQVFEDVKKAWDKTDHHFELCKKCTFRNRFKKEN